MNTMPMATYLAVEATRRQFDPHAEAEFVHDPIRLPRFRPARALVACTPLRGRSPRPPTVA